MRRYCRCRCWGSHKRRLHGAGRGDEGSAAPSRRLVSGRRQLAREELALRDRRRLKAIAVERGEVPAVQHPDLGGIDPPEPYASV